MSAGMFLECLPIPLSGLVLLVFLSIMSFGASKQSLFCLLKLLFCDSIIIFLGLQPELVSKELLQALPS